MSTNEDYEAGEVAASAATRALTKPDRPRKPEKPKHQDATAKIYIDGLSIMCYHPQTESTEFVFVKDHHNPIELYVFDRECKVRYFYRGTKDKQVRIDIRKDGTEPDPGYYYEDNKGDDEDFQWVPDMCDWYGTNEMTFLDGAEEHLSAKLVIQNAIFYTKVKSKIDALLVKSSKPKQKVGRVVGANIVCGPADTGISIEITDEDDIPPFPKEDGPYRVAIRTTTHDLGSNHMIEVYKDIIDPSHLPAKYFLQFEKKESLLTYNCKKDDFDETPVKRDGHAEQKDEHGDHPIEIEATEYACQPLGGGNGDPPPFP